MMQEMQGDLLKSKMQKTAEARDRLMALVKDAQKAGDFEAAGKFMADVALIDGTPNRHTAPRTLGITPNEGGQAMLAPELSELGREALMSIVQTGRLPTPKS
jgi:hypothetical protein